MNIQERINRRKNNESVFGQIISAILAIIFIGLIGGYIYLRITQCDIYTKTITEQPAFCVMNN